MCEKITFKFLCSQTTVSLKKISNYVTLILWDKKEKNAVLFSNYKKFILCHIFKQNVILNKSVFYTIFYIFIFAMLDLFNDDDDT